MESGFPSKREIHSMFLQAQFILLPTMTPSPPNRSVYSFPQATRFLRTDFSIRCLLRSVQYVGNNQYIEIAAKPYPFRCIPERTALLIIDMQNDFCAPGGFGELLGNDVTATKAIIPTIQLLLVNWRQAGYTVIHTREGHLPDLSDCPPSKLNRSRAQGAGIGDLGPLGRILVRGEQG